MSFSQAATRANINTGETVATISGKLKKWYADFKAVVWSGSYTDLLNKPTLGSAASQGIANNLTTTTAGYAMDARQGPVIQQHLNQINSNFEELNQNLGSIGSHSYNETDTGKTWIDGKRIYRKILTIQLKNANVACSVALPSGFDDAVSLSGVIRGNGITLGVGYVGDASSGWDNAVPYSVPVVVDKNAGTLYLRPLTNRTGYTAYVILEYTKV